MSKLQTPDSKAEKKLFHNELVTVYPQILRLDQIDFWKENNRTIFTFERLCRLEGKTLQNISIEEITRFVAEQDLHKIDELAASIERNGVQVPLILRDDGKLLDGNRRFFACQWLKMKYQDSGMETPESLKRIPVFVIRETDFKKNETLELKILAEANFIKDLKVAWPLDAQARAVEQYYEYLKTNRNIDSESLLTEVAGVFGINKRRALDLLETLQLTKMFIAEGPNEDVREVRRSIVEDKFVYFWEFMNKAMKGRGAYKNAIELDEIRSMFFNLMAMGPDNPITNVKQVEPLAQSRRDQAAWKLLKESGGSELNVVVAMINEKKQVRKAEDKIYLFLGWLSDVQDLTERAKSLLKDVASLALEKSLSEAS